MRKTFGRILISVNVLLLTFSGFIFHVCPALSADMTIAWDSNTEPDVRGYNVYFRKGSEGPPYDLVRYVDLQEIDPANPSFVVTGLETGTIYYLTVTALDSEGLESFYSNSVCAQVGDTILPCSTDGGSGGGGSGGGGSGGGGSGGGGGCFIGSLHKD